MSNEDVASTIFDFMADGMSPFDSGYAGELLDQFAAVEVAKATAPLLAHIERLQAQLDKHKDKYAPYSGDWAGTREGL